VRSAKGDTPNTDTLWNGASGNKMLDTFNTERLANSLGRIIRSAFAFRSSARALAAGLPRQDQVYKTTDTTDESFRFHNKKIDKIRCKLGSTENPRSFEKYPTPP